MNVKILIADDHSMFAESLAFNLNHNGKFDILKIVNNGKELLDACKFNEVDIILIDYNMPEMNGLDTTIELLKQHPNMKILVITMHSNSSIIKPLIKAGVRGIVLKNSSTSEVITAIEHIMLNKTYYSQEIVMNLTKQLSTDIQLTKREMELINLLKLGLNTKEIAEKLSVSTHTVESHRKNLLAKTDTHNVQAMLKVLDEHSLL